MLKTEMFLDRFRRGDEWLKDRDKARGHIIQEWGDLISAQGALDPKSFSDYSDCVKSKWRKQK